MVCKGPPLHLVILSIPSNGSIQFLHKEFQEAYKKGLENGKQDLRRKQWRLADRSAAMAIWLGKQYLGQKDIPDGESFPAVTIVLKPKQLAESDDNAKD